MITRSKKVTGPDRNAIGNYGYRGANQMPKDNAAKSRKKQSANGYCPPQCPPAPKPKHITPRGEVPRFMRPTELYVQFGKESDKLLEKIMSDTPDGFNDHEVAEIAIYHDMQLKRVIADLAVACKYFEYTDFPKFDEAIELFENQILESIDLDGYLGYHPDIKNGAYEGLFCEMNYSFTSSKTGKMMAIGYALAFDEVRKWNDEVRELRQKFLSDFKEWRDICEMVRYEFNEQLNDEVDAAVKDEYVNLIVSKQQRLIYSWNEFVELLGRVVGLNLDPKPIPSSGLVKMINRRDLADINKIANDEQSRTIVIEMITSQKKDLETCLPDMRSETVKISPRKRDIMERKVRHLERILSDLCSRPAV
jgi:hypothetical protein